MLGVNEIKKHNREQQQHLMTMFGDDSISKAISQEEFKERYESDHDVFSKGNIESFEKAVAEKVDENPEDKDSIISKAVEELTPLSKVLVKGVNSAILTFYVKRSEVPAEGGSVEGKEVPTEGADELIG